MKKERGVPVNREAMDEYQFNSNPERERARRKCLGVGERVS